MEQQTIARQGGMGTVLAVIIGLIIGAVLAGGLVYFWQQLELQKTISTVDDLKEQVAGLQNQVSQMAADQEAVEEEEGQEAPQVPVDGWLTYIDTDNGIMFQYPSGYQVSKANKFYQILPLPTSENGTPLPVMTLQIYDSQISGQEMLGKDVTPLEAEQIIVNRLAGQKLVYRMPDMPAQARCPLYALGNQNMTVRMEQYECKAWDQFEQVVNRFYFIYK